MKTHSIYKQVEIRFIALIEAIVIKAVCKISGIKTTNIINKNLVKGHDKSISVFFNVDFVDIDVVIDVNYGLSISEISCSLQEQIKKDVEESTKFKVNKTNIYVNNIIL